MNNFNFITAEARDLVNKAIIAYHDQQDAQKKEREKEERAHQEKVVRIFQDKGVPLTCSSGRWYIYNLQFAMRVIETETDPFYYLQSDDNYPHKIYDLPTLGVYFLWKQEDERKLKESLDKKGLWP